MVTNIQTGQLWRDCSVTIHKQLKSAGKCPFTQQNGGSDKLGLYFKSVPSFIIALDINTIKGQKHLKETFLMYTVWESDPFNHIDNSCVPRSSVGSNHVLSTPANSPSKDTSP